MAFSQGWLLADGFCVYSNYMMRKGSKHSKETKKKMSKARMGVSPWNKGKKNCFSKETIKKMSESHKGHYASEETKKKMSITRKGRISPLRGRHLSEEHKKKVSEAVRGKKHPFYGKRHTLESREKMSNSLKGRKSWNKGKSNYWCKGNKNHLWKGGIAPINKIIRRSPAYKEWREKVFERDNYTCQKTKVRSKKGIKIYLHPHHIKNFSSYPESRFDVNNGITLSEQAHRKFHKIYGRENNTQEQIIEFLN